MNVSEQIIIQSEDKRLDKRSMNFSEQSLAIIVLSEDKRSMNVSEQIIIQSEDKRLDKRCINFSEQIIVQSEDKSPDQDSTKLTVGQLVKSFAARVHASARYCQSLNDGCICFIMISSTQSKVNHNR